MSNTVLLTNDQINQIKTENKSVRMTDAQIEKFANSLVENIDIPFMPKNREQAIAKKIVGRFDDFLWETLPDEIYELINDASDGLDQKETNKLISHLTKVANKRINIKYLPEDVEADIIRYLLRKILKHLMKKYKA